MFNQALLGIAMTSVGLGFASTLMVSLPAQADTCTPLRVVGGQGFEVRKRIERRGGIVTSNNWNTDFIVPGGVRFNYYTITITAENTANYNVAAHFKYPDNSSSTVFENGSLPLQQWKPRSLNVKSPTGRQPFQVNLRIGGNNGNVYRARISACR